MKCLRAAVPRVGRAVRLAVRRGHRKSRRVLTFGLPTVWGAAAITYKLTCPLAQQNGLGARVASSAVFFAVGTGLIVHVRRALLRELRQARQVAGAAQRALLRPLPPRIGGLTVAAAQMSADRGATIGGDLYEAVATEHGVRVVMGDVRGHGLAAIGTAAAVLGSFREAVHDEPDLAGVLRRLDRAFARHLRERAERDGTAAEEFVTVLLLEIGGDGGLRALNCGHPWPYLLSGSRVESLSSADPLPPLGPFPLPRDLSGLHRGHLLPDETLVLHTDGAEDARDAHGRFFSLPEVLREASRNAPNGVLGAVFDSLRNHTGGTPTDDVALLVLRNERQHPSTSGARGTAPPATMHPQPTTHL
ncbi:PP2C family protein-serine/threonine phosphatase [Streptomyces canus]|uniref:PP2C family protein-serine/threonine phosphatase n=1 Tax=Streptomyces canus TaxID=58343 RepID=UPI0027885C63|nr:serine phosphatase RsbU (regulator of sigma subunit) [Streptomyces canus]